MKGSPEAVAIIAKLKKGKAMEPETDEDEGEESGDVSEEAKVAAAEDLFRAIRGREPTGVESAAVREALDAYHEACGY